MPFQDRPDGGALCGRVRPGRPAGGVDGWHGRTHLVARIGELDVLACTGAAAGETVRLVDDAVADGLACEACRRLWTRVAEQRR